MNYLKSSILYTLDFMPRILDKKDPELIAEPLLQLIRDIYEYKTHQNPFKPIAELASEIALSLDKEELSLLTLIENSQRKQKDYIESMADIKTSQLKSIMDKIGLDIRALD